MQKVIEAVGRLAKSSDDASRQLELLASLDRERHALVVARLEAIDTFLRSDRSSKKAEDAANLIGSGTRNLYRLIARVQDVGPVAGLVPRFRSSGASASAALPTLVDDWLSRFMALEPHASITRLEGYLLGRCDQWNELKDGNVAVPSTAAVKDRINELRRNGLLATVNAVGSDLLVDQVVLAMTATFGSRDYDVAATLVVDKSSIILGAGLSSLPDGIGMGLMAAFLDLSHRVPDLARAGLKFDLPRRIEWVVPAGLEGLADVVAQATSYLDPGIELIVEATGERRHAVRTVALLGDGLGRMRFKPRASMMGDNDADRSDNEAITDQAATTLREAVTRWNGSRLRVVELEPRQENEAAAATETLLTTLRALFNPLFAGIQDRFVDDDPCGPAYPRVPPFSF